MADLPVRAADPFCGPLPLPDRVGSAFRLQRVWLANGLIYLVFALLIGLPLMLVLIQAILPGLFDPAAGTVRFSLDPLIRTLSAPRITLSILHSLALAGSVALTATTLGAAYAFFLQRTDLPWRGLLGNVPWLVFLTPAYLKALAWVLLMSPGGYFAQFHLLPPGLSDAFFGLGGLVFVHTLNLFPLATFVIGGALTGLGSEFEDAARLSGAPLHRAWLRINLPLLAPAIALSVLAIFAEVLSDFGLASTIARLSNFGVLTYGIYTAASDYPVNFALAGAQSLVLLTLVAAVVLADRLLRRQTAARLISGRSRPSRRYALGPWRWPVVVIALIVSVLAIYLPLIAIVLRAMCRTLSLGLVADNLTAKFLLEAVTWSDPSNQALLRSLFFAAVTAMLACTVALLLALRLDRAGGVTRQIVLGLALGSVAIPGIVLGFGYILVWDRLPGFRDWPFPHYGDASLLVTGYVAAALPYCLVIVMTAIGQLAPSLTEAARLQGVGAVRRVIRVVLPLVAVSMLTAFLFTFLRTVFELPVSQLLIPVSGPPAPAMIVRLFAHDMDGLASALSLTAMAAVGGIAALFWTAGRLWFRRRATPFDVTGLVAVAEHAGAGDSFILPAGETA